MSTAIEPERHYTLPEVGPELARLTRECNALRYERDQLQARVALTRADMRKLQGFVRACWDEVHEMSKPDIASIRAMVDELVSEDIAGEPCENCGGHGAGIDEIPDAFGIQIHKGGCPSCDGTGRQPR